jgi:DNA-binding transcriptional MerR regulator
MTALTAFEEVEEKLTIQQVAEATGLSVHTLRYYERIGLIHHIGRAHNTHRRYTRDDIGWIDFLTKLRTTGMSIQQMVAYAEAQRDGDHTLAERLDMLRDHREKVEAHMRELHEYLDCICHKIEYYESVVPIPATPDLEAFYQLK